MGILKPLCRIMYFKSTVIYYNTSEMSLYTFSTPLNMIYTISDTAYVEDFCECTPVNSEQSLISENIVGSMNGSLPSTFCFSFTFDAIRAE